MARASLYLSADPRNDALDPWRNQPPALAPEPVRGEAATVLVDGRPLLIQPHSKAGRRRTRAASGQTQAIGTRQRANERHDRPPAVVDAGNDARFHAVVHGGAIRGRNSDGRPLVRLAHRDGFDRDLDEFRPRRIDEPFVRLAGRERLLDVAAG